MGSSKNSSSDPMQRQIDDLRITAFNNMAAVYFKMGKWRECKAKCTRVLEDDNQNIKALYYRGMAHRRMRLVKSAKSDFQTAQKLIREESNPMHQAIEREMNLLSKGGGKHKKSKRFRNNGKKSRR